MLAVNVNQLKKDFAEFPKFRHNLWTTFADQPSTTYLTVSHGTYEVPTIEAQQFLQFRGGCTGHHTIEGIAERAEMDTGNIRKIVDSLVDADILHREYTDFDKLSRETIIDTVFSACRIWSEQLAETGIAVDIQSGLVAKNVVVGWLLEQYHYIKEFPSCLDVAANSGSGPLRDILLEYANQERGHENFVLECLVNLGISRPEVENSVPLTTTRLIGFLTREMYARAPFAALLVASIVEACDLDETEASFFCREVGGHYGFPPEALQPLIDHMMIDDKLGHSSLARRHADLINFESEAQLHGVINQLHDIKHAFDAQKMEIKQYYSQTGNYLPRQYLDFFAI